MLAMAHVWHTCDAPVTPLNQAAKQDNSSRMVACSGLQVRAQCDHWKLDLETNALSQTTLDIEIRLLIITITGTTSL